MLLRNFEMVECSSIDCFRRELMVFVLLSFLFPLIAGGITPPYATIAKTDREKEPSSIRGGVETIHTELVQRNRRIQTQKDVVDYKLWEASRIPQVLKDWAEKYPDFIRVTTSQEAYGLPAAGEMKDCPFYEEKGCPNYFFTLQDFVTHPVDSSSSSHLPEVFWSGCLHGNERVGPTSVMEATSLLLEAAYCESLPRRSSSSHQEDIQEAKGCRRTLYNKGIDDVDRRWLARLVTTRRIVVAPTTNALGYYRNQRGEAGIDPNRDFPYDQSSSKMCMQTIAGRTANEIYREHMFQLALTFHGGMEVVSYEWGAPSWYGYLSPDDQAQTQIGGAYSRYGGGWETSGPYKFGTMNDMVYYVEGGMEDWAYAGSWTPDKVKPCTPETFGGYPKEKTTYNNSTLRVFNVLVETSDKKAPKTFLGSSLDVLNGDTKGNGHVSRNIRLSLLSADLVEPYVQILAVNNLALSDDIVPMTVRDSTSCMETNAVTIAKNADKVDIEWTVGGAMTIDETDLWYARWDDVATEDPCWTQPDSTDFLERVEVSMAGTGRFSTQGSQPIPEGSATGIKVTNGPLFRASIPMKKLKKGDRIMIMASARVDQSWKTQTENFQPAVPPQSHVVNARTNPNYYHKSNGKHIKGRLDWFSVPLTVVVGDYQDSIGKQGNNSVDVIERNPRFPNDQSIHRPGITPKDSRTDQLWFPVTMWKYLVTFVLLVSVSICGVRFFCAGRTHHLLKNQSGEEFNDLGFEQNRYSDQSDDEYEDDDSVGGVEIPSLT